MSETYKTDEKYKINEEESERKDEKWKEKMRQKGESMERNAEEGIRWRDDKKKEGDGERWG